MGPQRAIGQLSMDRIDEVRHLRLALISRGVETSASGNIIEISNFSSSDVLTTLREIAGSPPPAGADLAEHAAKLHREKY